MCRVSACHQLLASGYLQTLNESGYVFLCMAPYSAHPLGCRSYVSAFPPSTSSFLGLILAYCLIEFQRNGSESLQPA